MFNAMLRAATTGLEEEPYTAANACIADCMTRISPALARSYFRNTRMLPISRFVCSRISAKNRDIGQSKIGALACQRMQCVGSIPDQYKPGFDQIPGLT